MSIEERIARLERANCHWRWAAMGLVLMMAAVVCCAPSGSKTGTPCVEAAAAEKGGSDKVQDWINVKGIGLVDENGKHCGHISARNGAAELWFSSASGEASVSISTRDDSAHLYVSGPEDNVFISANGINLSRVTPEKARERNAVMKARREGKPITAERFREAFSESSVISLGRAETGGGIIDVYNPFGKSAVSMQSNKMNTGAVYVHKVDGSIGNALTVGR